MYSVNSHQVDWSEEHESWNTTCPFCEGEGEVPSEWEVNCPKCDVQYTTDEEPFECRECGEILDPDIDLEVADKSYCEHCEDGHLVTYWNTVWDPDMHNISDETVKQVIDETPCLLVYNEDEGRYFLTLGGCGMDLTPGLAKAWLMLGFKWLPLDWVGNMIRNRRDYIEYVVGKDWTPRIVEAMKETLQGGITNLTYDLERLEEWEEG